ncbi:MAG: 4-hydroxy-3-methylbut-2-enyl diphosphate reductase [Bacteroidales bacterium]|jgi:4-hydroxy-3-methylbut-2-enyl diphosphate reductase|uniref:4-hydroxy-3-methylbut-2-enyl diphosphate reductase n=1 Tax=Candidatus Cryptobacteroides bacterium TaxID=3085639 RepID=UPI002E9E21C3|nr:4-hydroxy-3-methylbut-2-enyl diphosphate reductase [Bacteroidales bacterium]
MAIQVEIEKHSGFCGGVIRAIGRAEKFLEESPGRTLYSLGDIVHNEAELRRLGEKGLVTVDKDGLMNIPDPSSETLLIRAHGEPPQTYSLAQKLGLTVIDCTCPVVLKLQKSIREAYERVKPAGGQIVIFGKIGHAEVLGLLGQVSGDAVVIENMPMLLSALEDGSIRTDKPLEIFSQTTKSPVEYSEICKVLESCPGAGLQVHNTICSQVASRHEELADFALRHDVIVFVSGVSSSNGKVLFDLCKSRNQRTYHISDPSELEPEWFSDGDKVGVCGATSTPGWLLEQVAERIFCKNIRK